MHKAMGSNPQHHLKQARRPGSAILAFGVEVGDQRLKGIFSYVMSVRLAWTTCDQAFKSEEGGTDCSDILSLSTFLNFFWKRVTDSNMPSGE